MQPDIPCQRCIGLWIKVYIPSRQSGRATGYDAYRFVCGEPCNEVRTDFRGSGKNFGVRGVESDYRIWLLSVSRRKGMKGTIALGKYADFVVLDENPLEAEKESLADIKVLLTIKENQVIYRRGKEYE